MAFNHKKSIAYMALKNNGQKPVLDLLSLLPFRPGGQNMPYMKMICKAGKTKEIAKFYTYWLQPKGLKRRPRVNPTTEQQRKINDRHLVKRLTRLLNANFNGDCWYVTFSYRKEDRPQDVKTLQKNEQKLLRDLRKVYKKEKLVLKYIWTAEVGKRGGTHIHMVLSPIDARKLRNIWPYGYTTLKPMEANGQYRRLAEYFIKYFQKTRDTDEQIQKKSYNPSKNLIRPVPVKRPMKGNRFSREIKVPAGWYLDKDSLREGFTADGYEFIYYTLIKEGG